MSLHPKTMAEFKAMQKTAAFKRQKRAEKGKALGLRKRKTRRKPSARKTAFLRLKELCKLATLLRAKRRNGGACEVSVLCGGLEVATLAYHVFPAATGNAIKYDLRNLLGACFQCNGAEYFDRKRGSYARWDDRHKTILGAPLWEELKASAGRKQISTAEAREMADAIQARIEKGEYQ